MIKEFVVPKNYENKKMSSKLVLTMFFSFLFLVSFAASLLFPTFVYACAALCFVAIIFLDEQYILCLLLFTYPYGLFLKVSTSGGTSLFTIVELFAIAIIFIKRIINKSFKIDCSFYFVASLLFVEMLVGIVIGGEGSLLGVVKIFNIIALFYIFCSNHKSYDKKLLVSFFLTSFFISTFIGVFKTRIPRLLEFYGGDINYEYIGNTRVLRFSGLFDDPNYFSIPLMLCIIIFLKRILISREKYFILNLAFLILSIACGIFTFSKSFFITLVLVLLIFAFSSTFERNLVFLSVLMVVLLLTILMMPRSLLNTIIYRFTKEDLTTGRLEIWNHYFNFFDKNPSTTLFGVGIYAPALEGKATHNMYIETLYEIGFFGFILYFYLIGLTAITFDDDRKYNPVNFLGFFVVLLMFFFLEGLTEFEFPFYLIVAYIIFSQDLTSCVKAQRDKNLFIDEFAL